jgi:hypothetical protein
MSRKTLTESGIAPLTPSQMVVPSQCCQKCGNCPEESAEEMQGAAQSLIQPGKFSKDVKVSILGLQHLYDIVDAEDVKIDYDIEIDYASWGINGVSVNLDGIIEVNVKCTKYGLGNEQDVESTKAFKVDLDKLKIHYDAARTIAPRELDIYIGPDHEILYKRSSITFDYISVNT